MLRIDSLQALEDFIEKSHQNPVVIFKHSTRCPISLGADDEIQMLIEEYQDMSISFGKILVVEHRDVSRYCAERLNVKHESPQVILLQNNNVRFSASHHQIRYDQLEPLFAKLF